jgi:hypothetical protein
MQLRARSLVRSCRYIFDGSFAERASGMTKDYEVRSACQGFSL